MLRNCPDIMSNLEKKSPLPESTSTIFICGKSNTGKSTLLNALLGAHVLGIDPLSITDRSKVLLQEETETVVRKTLQEIPQYSLPQITSNILIVVTSDYHLEDLQNTPRSLGLFQSTALIFFCTSAESLFCRNEQYTTFS